MDTRFELLGPTVIMESNHIGFAKLNFSDGVFLRRIMPVAIPHTAGKRLLRMRGPSPRKNLRQKLGDAVELGLHILRSMRIAAAALVAGFIPQVPAENAVIVRERRNDPDGIRLELRLNGTIKQARNAWTLHPARVVNARDRRMLRPK